VSEPNLTDLETAAVAALPTEHGTYLRLEQERLLSPFVLDKLNHAMEGHGSDLAR
jgi:hypothetical protein